MKGRSVCTDFIVPVELNPHATTFQKVGLDIFSSNLTAGMSFSTRTTLYATNDGRFIVPQLIFRIIRKISFWWFYLRHVQGKIEFWFKNRIIILNFFWNIFIGVSVLCFFYCISIFLPPCDNQDVLLLSVASVNNFKWVQGFHTCHLPIFLKTVRHFGYLSLYK